MSRIKQLDIKYSSTIDHIPMNEWKRLNNSKLPFDQYYFYQALEYSNSVSAEQGWQAHHLVASNNENIEAILPMYIKVHSWGEYVFDWAWAEAYERYNLDYYPKLVATTPFTPVLSHKLLSNEFKITDLFCSLTQHCEETNLNSWHLLYCDPIDGALPTDVYQRNTVQFHWFNRGYESFSDFIGTFTSRKRKNTLKERSTIRSQGIAVRTLTNGQIKESDLKFFYLTYQLTYLKRGHQPHLSYEFFKLSVENMPNNILLLIASIDNEDIASAMFFYDDTQLYGRYWGSIKQYNNLHFELCYYLGIEFCIKKNLKRFNPGTQGEHKIQRGFEPVLTYSYHWIKHEQFKTAIKDFCQREQKHMLEYQELCRQKLPFKKKL